MVRYLLDTNTCIQFLTGRSTTVVEHFKKTKPSSIALCSVVRSELSFGAWNSSKPLENFSNQMYFCNQFTSYPFDDACAEKYGEIRAVLKKEGRIIGPYDLQIAAIALTHNLTLVTHNTKEFSRVAHLKIIDWEE